MLNDILKQKGFDPDEMTIHETDIAKKVYDHMVDQINRMPVCECFSWARCGTLESDGQDGHHPSCKESKFNGVKQLNWAMGDDKGLSSETIFAVMTGVNYNRSMTPSDPSDFGRCYRLLQKFPQWKKRLHEVSYRYSSWKPFVENWSKLEELWEEEAKNGFLSCPKLYKLMQELRGL